MIKLMNGNGQIGSILKKKMHLINVDKYIYIYHTWNVQDKAEGSQKEEYKKLQSFIDMYCDQKIIFISTKSEKETWYTHYKQLAEAYVLLHCKQSITVRLPTIVGKGIIEQFQKDEAQPYGMIELITANIAAKEIVNLCSFAGLQKSFTINGDLISAELAYDLSRRSTNV